MTTQFVEEAQREFLDAISHYEEARAGQRFKNEVDRSILYVSRNRWFATTSASREVAIRSLAPDVKKLERKGYSEEAITRVVLDLVSGLSACIFNTPLDMWIETLLHREMTLLPPRAVCFAPSPRG